MEHKKFLCLAIVISLTPAMYRICMILTKYYVLFKENENQPSVGEWLFWKEVAFLLMALYVAMPCLYRNWNPLLEAVKVSDLRRGRCVVSGRFVVALVCVMGHLALVGHAVIRFGLYYLFVGFDECLLY